MRRARKFRKSRLCQASLQTFPISIAKGYRAGRWPGYLSSSPSSATDLLPDLGPAPPLLCLSFPSCSLSVSPVPGQGVSLLVCSGSVQHRPSCALDHNAVYTKSKIIMQTRQGSAGTGWRVTRPTSHYKARRQLCFFDPEMIKNWKSLLNPCAKADNPCLRDTMNYFPLPSQSGLHLVSGFDGLEWG